MFGFGKKKKQQLEPPRHVYEAAPRIKPDMFKAVAGYENEKLLILKALRATKPVHVLLNGRPGAGKTEMLLLLQAYLNSVEYCIGSSATQSGVYERLTRVKPKYFLVDEVDKMNKRDQSSMLNLMQSGKVEIMKSKKHISATMTTWVIATCNDKDKLIAPLLDRFFVIDLQDITDEEFIANTIRILGETENIRPDVAEIIAQNILERRSIREAVRIARMCGNDVSAIQWVIETFRRQT
jgi:holliday junction DNA helicase RuvB